MNDFTIERLKKVSRIMYRESVFPSQADAFTQLKNDYPKGYPDDRWINEVLGADKDGRLCMIGWDVRTGNYNANWSPKPKDEG